jgi:hypothetical protein
MRGLFLFLLLICDWLGDPYFGRSPLSQPMSSQIAYCKSVDYSRQQPSAPILLRTQDTGGAQGVELCMGPVSPFRECPPFSFDRGQLIYTLMSIQR